MVDALVVVENLCKEYASDIFVRKKIAALRHVSFEIRRGEILAILGVNGAGKSTLTKCMLDLVHPTTGSIRIYGRENAEKKDCSIGYLPEKASFPPYTTARGILRFFGRVNGLQGLELEKRIDETLQLVALYDAQRIKTQQYSKGMTLRLGIAQAILHNPHLLFFDEPTDGLDPLGKIMVRNLLRQLAEKGKTIVLNSHLLSEVEMVADRAIILHRGEIVREGRLSELLPKEPGFTVELPPSLVLPSQWKAEIVNNSYRCLVQGGKELQELLQYLQSIGVAPLNVQPSRMTLEDVFLSTIQSVEQTH